MKGFGAEDAAWFDAARLTVDLLVQVLFEGPIVCGLHRGIRFIRGVLSSHAEIGCALRREHAADDRSAAVDVEHEANAGTAWT